MYAASALIPISDTGVSLTAAIDLERYAVGAAIGITATIVENGQPVIDATVNLAGSTTNLATSVLGLVRLLG